MSRTKLNKQINSNYQSLYLWTSFLLGMISLGIVIWNREKTSSVVSVNHNDITAQAGMQSSFSEFLGPHLHASDNSAQFLLTHQINFASFASLLALSAVAYQLSGNSFIGLLSRYNLFLATTVSAQPYEVQTIVPEFQVNTFTGANQYAPAIATFSSGECVIAWLSGSTNAIIRAQRFAQNGQSLGTEFQVNINAVSSFPKLISFVNDDWVAVWISGNNISARRFMKNGTAWDKEFQVNSAAAMPNSASTLVVGGLTISEWAVVWGDKKSNDFDLYAQRLSINGSVIGSQFRVNTNTTANQYNPTFKTLDTGDWLVVWQGYQTGDFDLYAQRFAANGTPLGEEFRVNANVTDHQQGAVIASVNENWLVAWLSGNGDTNIYARWFAKNGTALDQEFQVNSDNTQGTRSNLICMNVVNDNLILGWRQIIKRSSSPYPLYARRFAEKRSVVGPEFGMNINTSASLLSNFVLSNLVGMERWIGAWSVVPQSGYLDVYATIFLFQNSFEIPTAISSSVHVTPTSFFSIQQTNTTFISTTSSMTSHISAAPTTLTMKRNLANTTMTPSSSSTITTPIIASVVGGGLGLAACLGAVGLYCKKSRANKAENVVQKEAEISLQDKSRANSTSKNYSRIDEVKNPENQYDNAPKLEI